MPFNASAGRILITDDNGDVTLDTDERQFVFTDGLIEGSITVPSYESYSQLGDLHDIVNRDADTVLDSISPFATTVFGALRISYDQPVAPDFDSLASEGWFQATGSYVQGMNLINSTGNVSGGIATKPWFGVCAIQVFTFRAAGGQLIFNEQSQVRPFSLALGSTKVITVTPETLVEYKLYCGTFV